MPELKEDLIREPRFSDLKKITFAMRVHLSNQKTYSITGVDQFHSIR